MNELFKWIPIEEGLPEKDCSVLITVDRYSSILEEWVIDDVISDDFYNGEFGINRIYCYDDKKPVIKAWGYMPIAFKKGEE